MADPKGGRWSYEGGLIPKEVDGVMREIIVFWNSFNHPTHLFNEP